MLNYSHKEMQICPISKKLDKPINVFQFLNFDDFRFILFLLINVEFLLYLLK